MTSAKNGLSKQTKEKTKQEQILSKSQEPAVGLLQTGMVKQKNLGLAKKSNPELRTSKQLKQRNAHNCNKIACSFKDFTLNIIHIFVTFLIFCCCCLRLNLELREGRRWLLVADTLSSFLFVKWFSCKIMTRYIDWHHWKQFLMHSIQRFEDFYCFIMYDSI